MVYYWPVHVVVKALTKQLIFCSVIGLMVIDNIDAIADALGISPSAFFVTLISLANGAGRY